MATVSNTALVYRPQPITRDQSARGMVTRWHFSANPRLGLERLNWSPW